jgi:hypothetical protein
MERSDSRTNYRKRSRSLRAAHSEVGRHGRCGSDHGFWGAQMYCDWRRQVILPGQGGTVYFTYDPFGRRIRKVFGSATTIYAGVYPERSRRDSDNVKVQWIVAGDK